MLAALEYCCNFFAKDKKMEGAFLYFIIATWFVFSLLVNVQIKTAVTTEHIDVFTITSGQFFLPLMVLAFISVKDRKNLKLNLSQDYGIFILVGVCFYLGNLATNFALASLNISSAHVLKATEPIFAVLFNYLLFKKAVQLLDLIPLVTVCCSVAAFSLEDFSFSKHTFAAVLFANIFLQIRNVLASNLLPQKSNVDSFYSFIVISSVASVLSLTVQTIQNVFLSMNTRISLWHGYTVLLTVSLAFFGMHSASYIALGFLHPVKHSLYNVFKRGFIIFGSCILLANTMSYMQFFCTLLSLFALCQFLNISFLQSKSWLISACGLSIGLLLYNAQSFVQQDSDFMGSFYRHSNMTGNSSFSHQITFVWHEEFNEKSHQFVKLIEKRFPDYEFVILCTYSGVENCKRLKNAKIIVLTELCADTLLLQWIREHVRYKIIAGPSYREQLLYVVSLCTLWKYGGLVLTSRTTFDHIELISVMSEDFVSQDLASMQILRKQSPVIRDIMTNFFEKYPVPGIHEEVWPLWYNYLENALEIARKNKISIVKTNYALIEKSYEQYGALSFDKRIKVMSIANVGDEIQTMVAIQFYPYLTTFLDRESLADYNFTRKLTILMNSWMGDDRIRFSNSTNFYPILTSIHISGEWIRKPDSISYLQLHGPIGARDNRTLETLRLLRVPSYLSGCATMLLKNPFIEERTDKIYAIDVPDEILKDILPPEIYGRLIVMSHKAWPYIHTLFGRSMKALNLALKYYAQAHIVITSRLHAAMPCVGLKTPVIFVRTEDLPGGNSSRIDGLDVLWHTIDVTNKAKISEAKTRLSNFDWDSPPANPNAPYAIELQEKMLTHIFNASPQFVNVATMFGWIDYESKDNNWGRKTESENPS